MSGDTKLSPLARLREVAASLKTLPLDDYSRERLLRLAVADAAEGIARELWEEANVHEKSK